MSMNGVNKAMNTVNSVVKKGTKVFANALPIVSIAGNVVGAHRAAAGDIPNTIERIIWRYTGINPQTGEFSGSKLMLGTGSLVMASIARFALKFLA